VKCFDHINLAEAPLEGIAYSSDRQTFVMIGTIINSVVIKGLYLFWRTSF